MLAKKQIDREIPCSQRRRSAVEKMQCLAALWRKHDVGVQFSENFALAAPQHLLAQFFDACVKIYCICTATHGDFFSRHPKGLRDKIYDNAVEVNLHFRRPVVRGCYSRLLLTGLTVPLHCCLEGLLLASLK